MSGLKTYNASRTLAEFHADNSLVRAVAGPIGCLPAETEFLSDSGWVRMDEWNGHSVAEWSEATGEIRFARPLRFIDEPCDTLIEFRTQHSLHMVVSDEHRVPAYNWNGEFVVKTGAELERKPSRHRIINTFGRGGPSTMSDEDLRLWVAIAADGNYPKRGKQCKVVVRKERKKERIRYLLDATGTEFYERVHSGRPTETTFTFDRPDLPKLFDDRVYHFTSHMARVAVDELQYWDGLHGYDYDRFSTSIKDQADKVQFLCHLAGRRATINTVDYTAQGWSTIYNVHIARTGNAKNNVCIRGDSTDIRRVVPSDGRKYCFTTNTGFFVVRHNGCIFVTGNSGKSVGMCVEIFNRACTQRPFKGVRKSRWAVIRNTYSMLETTTIRTFMDWFGPFGTITYGSPITFVSKQQLPDGTSLELEVMFFPMDREDDVKRLLSLELTGAWLNEARELPLETFLDPLIGRLERYPSKSEGGASWYGVIMDTNMPGSRSYFYKLFEEIRPKGFRLFKQPPALLRGDEEGTYLPNPEAENVENHESGFDYYMRQTHTGNDNYIKTMILAEYGEVHDGQPVFHSFRPRMHAVDAEKMPNPARNMPLIVGMDFGLNPAAVVAQLTPHGGINVFAELSPRGVTLEQFLDEDVIPLLMSKFPNHRVQIVGDPAGGQRSALSQMDSFGMIRMRGLSAIPAATNDFIMRRDAVDFFLRKQSGFAMSAECSTLFGALSGGYKYEMRRSSGGSVPKERPDKTNIYSHIADALQYACLYYYRQVARPVRPPTSSSSQKKVRFA